MGLPLYNASDSLAHLTEERLGSALHQPPSRMPARKTRRSGGSRAKDADPRRLLRERQAAALEDAHWLHRQRSSQTGAPLLFSPPRTRPRSRVNWTSYDQESADPGDSGTHRRPPSLERQEAFVDSSTTKRQRSLDDYFHQDKAAAVAAEDADAIADLYHLGLLYDDEHLRGSGFGFEALAHGGDHPQYTLSFRHAGPRVRRRKAPAYPEQRHGGGSPFLSRMPAPELSLEGAPNQLGEYDEIATFLISPRGDELEEEEQVIDDFDLISIPDTSNVSDLVYDDDDDEENKSGVWVIMDSCEGELGQML